jgi:hypothetical protein
MVRIIMVRIIMVSVIKVSVIMLSVIMMITIMLSVITLSVIMQCHYAVIMLLAVATFEYIYRNKKKQNDQPRQLTYRLVVVHLKYLRLPQNRSIL